MKQLKTILAVVFLVFFGMMFAPSVMMDNLKTVESGKAQQSLKNSDNEGTISNANEALLDEKDLSIARGTDNTPQTRGLHFEPEDFPDANRYYLISESIDTLAGGRYLDGLPLTSDGRNTKLNKADLHLPHPDAAPPEGYDVGNRMYYRFPRNTATVFNANFNHSFPTDPFINISFNTLRSAGKEINIEILIDADGDFDVNDPQMSAIEGIIRFPTYTTQKPAPSWDVQTEEVYESNGSWVGGGFIPEQIRDGAIYLTLYRTDNIFDPEFPFLPDLLIYTGLTNKSSWLALPYEHKVAPPYANASYDYIKSNQYKWYGIWEPPSKGMAYDDVPEYMKMKPFDTITFNASRSFDINDDFNGNKNIDDGVPTGELEMDDERDTLQYRWFFGDGKSTDWQDSPMAVHKYSMDPLEKENTYTATVHVRSRLQHYAFDSCVIRIFNEEHPPEINRIDILPKSTDPLFPDYYGPRAVENQEVQFVGYAIDLDPWDLNDLRYEWDLNGDSVVDAKGKTVTTSYGASQTYDITLWVYDGEVGNESTLMDSMTTDLYISKNDVPVARITASHVGDKPVENSISAEYNVPIVFNSTTCYDPDNLPGFDVSSPKDFIQDHNLSFRWHWNQEREDETVTQGLDPYADSNIISPWTFNLTTRHTFTSADYVAGSNYAVDVYLEVDDGEDIIKSGVFRVNLNLKPVADFYINNKTDLTPLDRQPGAGEKILFDASLSYDPNDDLNGDGVVRSPEVDRLTYSWSFDDGTTADEKIVTHAFAEKGDHTVILTVSDGHLASSKLRHVIIMEQNFPPVIVMSVTPASGPTHYPFTFTSGDSYDTDPNDDVVKFKWDFGDGYESLEPDTTHSYSKEGLYNIVLTITDRRGATTVDNTRSIYIYNREPFVVINLKGDGVVEIPVKMSATASDTDGTIEGYYWEFGDGDTEDWSPNNTKPTHTYDETGTYTVKVIVKDDKGKTNSSTAPIKISVPPTPDKGGDEAGVESGDILFWIIIAVVIAVIVIAIVVIVWRIRREAL